MTTDLHTLAAAVVQSPRWRWRPGMLAAAGSVARVALRVLVIAEDGVPVEWAGVTDWRELHIVVTGYGTPGWCADVWLHDALPDLSDPATLGCLLALVREAWGDPGLHVSIAHGGYCFVRHAGGADLRWAPTQCDSEPAALVAALLAATPPEPAG